MVADPSDEIVQWICARMNWAAGNLVRRVHAAKGRPEIWRGEWRRVACWRLVRAPQVRAAPSFGRYTDAGMVAGAFVRAPGGRPSSLVPLTALGP